MPGPGEGSGQRRFSPAGRPDEGHALAGGAPPVVWERNAQRMDGAVGYTVVDPANDPRRDYRAIYDVSGDASLLDSLIGRIAPGGEIVLAGSFTRPVAAKTGDVFDADYGPLGRFEFTFV